MHKNDFKSVGNILGCVKLNSNVCGVSAYFVSFAMKTFSAAEGSVTYSRVWHTGLRFVLFFVLRCFVLFWYAPLRD